MSEGIEVQVTIEVERRRTPHNVARGDSENSGAAPNTGVYVRERFDEKSVEQRTSDSRPSAQRTTRPQRVGHRR